MKIVVDALSDQLALLGVHDAQGETIAELQVEQLLHDDGRHRGYRIQLTTPADDDPAADFVIEG